GSPAAIVDAVRNAVRQVNPDEAIFDVKTMERIIDESMSSFSLYLRLMILFAALALGLALTGTYGVMAYATASRAREFAIRVALGASGSAIMRLAVRRGLLLTTAGVMSGLLIAIPASPLLRVL